MKQTHRSAGRIDPWQVTAAKEMLQQAGLLRLAKRTARECCVSLESILGEDRTRAATRARRRLWALARHTLDLPYLEMERLFGFDHSTLILGIKKRERELQDGGA